MSNLISVDDLSNGYFSLIISDIAIIILLRKGNFQHLSKTKIVPIIATDDEHKLSHIQLSIYYYEEWNSSMGRKWYEKYLKDDANTECGAQRTDQIYPRNQLLKSGS